MAIKRSAGILLFRRCGSVLEVLLGHMGGPLWERRDAAGWSVPKGEYEPDEDPVAAARREFEEEVGIAPPADGLVDLGSVRQSSGKLVTVWAVEGDLDPQAAVPGTFTMEWPRGSGRMQEFPELDRVEWFSLDHAGEKLVAGQRPFLDRLVERLGEREPSRGTVERRGRLVIESHVRLGDDDVRALRKADQR